MEMNARLAGVEAKLRRARKHRGELLRKVDAWAGIETPQPIVDHELKTGMHVVRLKPPRLPLEWSVIVGDYVFALRSALDHLVYGLAIESGAMPPKDNRLTFTIESKGSARFAERAAAELRGLRSDWVQLIERQQPYHGHQRGRSLAAIADLNNFDKHRALHAGAVVISEMEPEHLFEVTSDRRTTSWRVQIWDYVGQALEDAKLYAVEVRPISCKLAVRVLNVPPVTIGFGQPGELARLEHLGGLLEAVTAIVEDFRPMFAGR